MHLRLYLQLSIVHGWARTCRGHVTPMLVNVWYCWQLNPTFGQQFAAQIPGCCFYEKNRGMLWAARFIRLARRAGIKICVILTG